MKTLYIIVGTTGEYSDRSEWLVEAHSDEAAAQKRVLDMNAYLREKGMSNNGPGWDDDREDVIKKTREDLNDKKFGCDYTGTQYYLDTVPIMD